MNFTNYWESFAVYYACKLNLFDFIQSGKFNTNSLAKILKLDLDSLKNIIGYLEQKKYIEVGEFIGLTPQGFDFTDQSKTYLKEVCILWHEEHLTAWQNGLDSLRTGKSSYEKLYGENFFDSLIEDSTKLDQYHKAMTYYARSDYKTISSVLNLDEHKFAIDIGAGYGALIEILMLAYPNIEYTHFDLEKTISMSPKNPKVHYQSGNFFEPLNLEIDAVFLARILHDWNDRDVNTILKNIAKSMSKKSKLYIIEIRADKIESHPYLLNLNMQFICGSKERTEAEYKNLLNDAGIEIEKIISLNSLQSILICQLK